MKINIVLGLGYGDEGKGNVINAISTPETLVIRFNGGQQVGHTVIENGKKHVFSSFGSGSIKGAKTYISRFCTIDPIAMDIEKKVLGFYPKLYLDADAMITTLYDVWKSKSDEHINRYGSTGMGVGTTIDRNKNHYSLRVRDLFYPDVLRFKLDMIKRFYGGHIILPGNEKLAEITKADEYFIKKAIGMVNQYTVVESIKDIPDFHKHIVFEGAQGIMLDMDHGFFPHVTYSNTTSKNVMSLLKEWKLDSHSSLEDINTYYVTRVYQTRHGNGPMTYEGLPHGYLYNPDETNKDDGIQGKFRYGMLDIDMLKYALKIDSKFNSWNNNKKLVMTCMDQASINGQFNAVLNGKINGWSPEGIAKELEIPEVITSNSPTLKL